MSWTMIREPHRNVRGLVDVIAGENGRVEIRPERTLWVPHKGKKIELAGALWGLTITPAGPVAFAVDGTPWMLRDNEFEQAGPTPAGFTLRERTTSGWDPTRGATVMMSGAPAKGKAKLKDAWAFDGATMTKLAIEPPIRVVAGDAAFSPALGALVVAGGNETWRGERAPTYELRGDSSASFPPVAGRSAWSPVLTTDPVTGLVVSIGLDSAAVYLGSGRWRTLPPPPEGTRVAWFEPATRTFQATVHIDPMRSQHACAIGDLLDALPSVKR